MNEEIKKENDYISGTSPEKPPDTEKGAVVPAEDTKVAGKKPKRGRNFLWVYIVALFSVAFVLILLSYMSQVRSNSQLESIRQQIHSSAELAENAARRNDELQALLESQKEAISEMEGDAAVFEMRIAALEAALSSKEEEAKDEKAEKEKIFSAYDMLWQLEKAYSGKEKAKAREILEKMEELSAESVLAGDALEEYGKIKDALS